MILLSNLAFDCADASRVASFWRQAIGYEMPEPTPQEIAAAIEEHPEWAGLAIVDEEQHRHPRLFLQTVPEAKIGRNRVRPVIAADVDRLVALGAKPLDGDGFGDTEGNEFRVTTSSDTRFVAVEIDALDPESQCAFWSEMLGFEREGTTCRPPAAWQPRVRWFPSFVFTPIQEPKQRKNRIHFDFLCRPSDGDHARLLAMGATDFRHGDGFVTMQDTEGNEFDLTFVG